MGILMVISLSRGFCWKHILNLCAADGMCAVENHVLHKAAYGKCKFS
jgi:hypothetical protein